MNIKWTLFFLALSAVTAYADDAPKPNIVLIISDDQGWTDYGFMGHAHIQTPSLDLLATQSLTFTRGYVPDSLCRPSLATIITGRYPHQHGIVGNDPPLPASLRDLPAERRLTSKEYAAAREAYLQHIDRAATLPKLLGQAGYLSFQSGKWWEGNYSRGGFTHGMTHGDVGRGGRHGDEGLTIGRKGLQPIFDFIQLAQQQQKPFFVWYAPMMPHAPHEPPERLLDHYRDKTNSIHVARYWAMCNWFDETCGELLGYLEKHELAENTIVIYVTDNGWINQENSSQFAPKSKRSPYDGGVRTPIMVRWPGKVKPQRDETTLVSSIDLVPTILHAVDVKVPDDLPGLNFLDASALAGRDTIYGEIFEHDIQHLTDPLPSLMYRWVIEKNWKLIKPNASRVPDGVVELYDLNNDPFEKKNLADGEPELTKRLSEKLEEWWPKE